MAEEGGGGLPGRIVDPDELRELVWRPPSFVRSEPGQWLRIAVCAQHPALVVLVEERRGAGGSRMVKSYVVDGEYVGGTRRELAAALTAFHRRPPPDGLPQWMKAAALLGLTPDQLRQARNLG